MTQKMTVKLTLTFEVNANETPRTLRIPFRWLSLLANDHDARHATIDILLMSTGSTDYAKAKYDSLPIEELDVAWTKIRDILLDRGDLDVFNQVELPTELLVIMDDIVKHGPHRVEAPDAMFILLAEMLEHSNRKEFRDFNPMLEPWVFTNMLKGCDADENEESEIDLWS